MRKFSVLMFLLCSGVMGYAQEKSPLEISGYADAYWKYDFSKQENIKTYFANDQNSISLGMLGLGLKKSTGKATFVGELAFGPRGQYLSIPNGDDRSDDDGNSFHIQNLYASFDFTPKLNVTAGFMSTFIGYEVISPVPNFHYSTSYLFGAGPFQNAGIKATYAFSDKVSLMAGVFNDWNVYRDLNGVSHVGAQLTLQPIDGLTTYVNFLSGSSAGGENNYSSGTLIDFVSTYQLSNKFNIAVNAANYNHKSEGGYYGVALYPEYNITDHAAIGLRGEYFKNKDISSERIEENIKGAELKALTLTARIKYGGLSFIPELRLDHDDSSGFMKADGITATSRASQASLAFVYAF